MKNLDRSELARELVSRMDRQKADLDAMVATYSATMMNLLGVDAQEEPAIESPLVPFPLRADWYRSEISKRGWTTNKVSTRSGLAPQTLKRIRDGESVKPESLDKLAKAFGVKSCDVPVN